MRSFRLIAVGLVGVALLAGLSATAQPVPESRAAKAKIMVHPISPDSGEGKRMATNRQEFMGTQTVILTSQHLADRIAKTKEVAALARFAGADAAMKIAGCIKATITSLEQTTITLEASGIPAEEGAVVLTAAINVYQDYVDELKYGKSGQLLTELNNARKDLEAKIAATDTEYRKYIAEHGTNVGARRSPEKGLFEDLSDKAQKLKARRIETMARRAFLIAQITNGANSDSIKARVCEWAAQHGFTKELATTRVYQEWLQFEIDESEAIETALNKATKDLKAQLQEQQTYVVLEESLRDERERAKVLYRQVLTRIEQMDLDRDRSGVAINVLSKPH